LVAEISNGPSLIAVGAIAQGYQTAPESAGQEPSEGTFRAWMPADSATGTGTINHNTIATVTDRVAKFIVVPSDACTLTSSDLNRPCNGTASEIACRRMRSVSSHASLDGSNCPDPLTLRAPTADSRRHESDLAASKGRAVLAVHRWLGRPHLDLWSHVRFWPEAVSAGRHLATWELKLRAIIAGVPKRLHRRWGCITLPERLHVRCPARRDAQPRPRNAATPKPLPAPARGPAAPPGRSARHRAALPRTRTR